MGATRPRPRSRAGRARAGRARVAILFSENARAGRVSRAETRPTSETKGADTAPKVLKRPPGEPTGGDKLPVNDKTVLAVDDDPEVLDIVRARLEFGGYRVLTADTAETGLAVFYRDRPDLALLDISLPGMDGYELASRIREVSQIPIIFLTARGAEDDRVRGLTSGADDYVVKPFGGKELVARVDAALRRAGMPAIETESDVYSDEVVSIDHRAPLVTVRGQAVDLTAYEYRLLSVFVGHPGQVLGQEQLLDLVWGADAVEASIDSVRLYVGYLRRKIEEDPREPELIETVRGFGYRYVTPVKNG